MTLVLTTDEQLFILMALNSKLQESKNFHKHFVKEKGSKEIIEELKKEITALISVQNKLKFFQ